MKQKQHDGLDPEIAAIGAVYKALEDLSPESQSRVLNYVANKLNVGPPVQDTENRRGFERSHVPEERTKEEQITERSSLTEEGVEGISPVAKKWMVRNGLKAEALSSIFSLGGDEIDLIAPTVTGNSKRDKMHSVLLLKGVAAYLGSGAARFTYQQLKEACVHYKAYDAANFATTIKAFSAEVSGDKNSGYSLTARGLAGATEIVRAMLTA